MEKKKTIWKKNICLNVFENSDGEEVISISKAYFKFKEGKKFSPFFNTDRGDLTDLVHCILEYKKAKDKQKIEVVKEVA